MNTEAEKKARETAAFFKRMSGSWVPGSGLSSRPGMTV